MSAFFQAKRDGHVCVRPFFSSSGGEGSRTLDLSIANAALSQLSYAPSLCPRQSGGPEIGEPQNIGDCGG